MTDAVSFRVLDVKRADDLFTAPRDEQKWSEVVRQLILGNAVFVPDMSRVARESLRSIISHRKLGVLRTRKTSENGQGGMILRLDRTRQPGS